MQGQAGVPKLPLQRETRLHLPSSQAAGGGHRANVSGRPEAGVISSLVTLPLDCEFLKDLTVTSWRQVSHAPDHNRSSNTRWEYGRKDAPRRKKNERKTLRARQKWYFSKCCFYNVLKIKKIKLNQQAA